MAQKDVVRERLLALIDQIKTERDIDSGRPSRGVQLRQIHVVQRVARVGGPGIDGIDRASIGGHRFLDNVSLRAPGAPDEVPQHETNQEPTDSSAHRFHGPGAYTNECGRLSLT